MTNGHWTLNPDGTLNEVDLMTWARWFENASKNRERVIEQTRLKDKEDNEILISTVFLGIDHNFGDGLPLLFETMVFRGKLDQHTVRYATKIEAQEGHKKVVRKVKATI